MSELDMAKLEEQLAEVRARRFMAERDAAAALRQAGLSKEPKKLDKATASIDSRVIKWREKETELGAKIEALRKEVASPPQEATTAQEPEETEAGGSPGSALKENPHEEEDSGSR